MAHAVIVHPLLAGGQFGSVEEHETIYALEREQEEAIVATSSGEFDGDEFGGNECVLYMYGPDADRLYASVEPKLKSTRVASGGYAIKRYGDAQDTQAWEVRVSW